MAKSVDWLLGNIDMVNLVPKLDEETQKRISKRVLSGYETDIQSRSEWEKKTEDGLKVAKQIAEKKSFPWQGAANVKFPLIATASLQFAARAYPQIVNGSDIVKAQVLGDDPQGTKEQRAKRVSQHMSWQLTEQMTDWEPDMDQLLHGLPVMGTYFKKTFYDPLYQRNRSIALTPFEVVINLKHKGTLDTCRRISHKIYLYKNQVLEREAADLFVGGSAEKMTEQMSDEAPPQELFVEQHCWYDLDEDGYEEPYIVTIHHTSGHICRMVPNYDLQGVTLRQNGKVAKIDAVQYFTKFSFIPSPDGEFYDVGFAHLLGPINEAMSTLINQMLDAGSLANTGGGFIAKGLRWQGGRLNFELGEWKTVDTVGMSLKDSIMPLPVAQPSSVLFQLLGLLNDQGQKLAAVSDAMSGEMPSQNTPATTTLAMIEQGLKVFTAIYKRVFRALKEEYKKIYRLNGLYLDETEYFRLLDTQIAISQRDYALDDLDIAPVADPTMSSEAQRLARANALLQTMQLNPDPMGQMEILRQYYDAIGAKNLDRLLDINKMTQQMLNPPPNPEAIKLELEVQKAKDEADLKLDEAEVKRMEAVARIQKLEAEIEQIKASTMKTLAEAEAVEPGQQMDYYRMISDDLHKNLAHDREMKKLELGAADGERSGDDTEGAATGMVELSDDESSDGGSTIPAGAVPEQTPDGGNIESQLAGTDGNADYASIGSNLRSQFAAGDGSGGV
jgi:chaperonin GroES